VAADVSDLAEPGATLDERGALNSLYSAAYDELRRLAARMRRGSGATISPTTLVNEAWLKLANSPGLACASSLHFKRLAARAMRQVLVDAARKRQAKKRGGDDIAFVTFDESVVSAGGTAEHVLALDAALEELGRLKPRHASMVECRVFAGLGVAETAEALRVSEATVMRDWRVVKAWLRTALQRAAAT
jgi:RNA polymerase sigma factor (TIGR02999 family)